MNKYKVIVKIDDKSSDEMIVAAENAGNATKEALLQTCDFDWSEIDFFLQDRTTLTLEVSMVEFEGDEV